MLSILIPIYNIDVTSLVGDLVEQAQLLDSPVEIICIDDHSDDTWKKRNALIRKFRNVTYKELPGNLGRSKIRNLLASEAQYPRLLFLDSDSKIIRLDFLLKYAEAYDEQSVVVGGRTYPDKSPKSDFHLHWKYGSLIEQKATSDFQSNNFLIPASVFKRYPFDESLTRYGHEDTLFWASADSSWYSNSSY
ncbi:MAG: glycosyltransferase family 2 protein [Saprospiraceae bacterium]|nr:glycosyltransferase family 2 protein [Saprospiraceae bacterium]